MADKLRGEDVLTLSEAASLLRVEESALAELASQGAVPAQKIGAEWRFLKGAIMQWLYYGSRFQDVIRLVPHLWLPEPILTDKYLALMEKHLLGRVQTTQQPAIKPGSKTAVGRHVGVFERDADLEKILGDLSSMREVEATEGGE